MLVGRNVIKTRGHCCAFLRTSVIDTFTEMITSIQSGSVSCPYMTTGFQLLQIQPHLHAFLVWGFLVQAGVVCTLEMQKLGLC